MNTTRNSPAEAGVVAHMQLLESLPMHDDRDFADAHRCFLEALEPGTAVRDAGGPSDAGQRLGAFLPSGAPTTANARPWRQSTLNAMPGFDIVTA